MIDMTGQIEVVEVVGAEYIFSIYRECSGSTTFGIFTFVRGQNSTIIYDIRFSKLCAMMMVRITKNGAELIFEIIAKLQH